MSFQNWYKEAAGPGASASRSLTWGCHAAGQEPSSEPSEQRQRAGRARVSLQLAGPAVPPSAGRPSPCSRSQDAISLVQLIFVPATNSSFFVTSHHASGRRFLMDSFLRCRVLIPSSHGLPSAKNNSVPAGGYHLA